MASKMQVVVTEMPETPRDCLFSVPAGQWQGEQVWVCTLHEYIPESKTCHQTHGKPKCRCKDTSKCTLLKVVESDG